MHFLLFLAVYRSNSVEYILTYLVYADRPVHRVSEKTSTYIIGYKLRNSCLILIIS